MLEDAFEGTAAGQAHGALFAGMCKVLSVCLPVFGRMMQSSIQGLHEKSNLAAQESNRT
jgi:hypothetical protein